MKRASLLLFTILLLSVFVTGCIEQKKPIELKTSHQKFSYSYGLSMGQNFKLQELDVDPDILLKGVKDGLNGVDPLLTKEQIEEVKTKIQEEVTAKANVRREKLAEKNKRDGETFLAANAANENIVTLESGLQYKIIEDGDGPTPKVSDTVTVHYRGILVDGTEFDSSQRRGQPVTFPVGGVIPGWTEALQAMNTGSKWQIFIPPTLAYGESGAGPLIGPNATLIFDVELIKIN